MKIMVTNLFWKFNPQEIFRPFTGTGRPDGAFAGTEKPPASFGGGSPATL